MISGVGCILYYSKAALLARQDLNLQPPGPKPGVPPVELRAIAYSEHIVSDVLLYTQVPICIYYFLFTLLRVGK